MAEKKTTTTTTPKAKVESKGSVKSYTQTTTIKKATK